MSIQVTIRHGEPVDLLLRRFKRLCVREGIFKEVKKRRYYEKPSDRRRREVKECIRQVRRAERKRARAARNRRR